MSLAKRLVECATSADTGKNGMDLRKLQSAKVRKEGKKIRSEYSL